jgi:hypothetical protein
MKTATEQFADEFNRGIDEELERIEPKAKVLEFNDAPAQTNGHEGGAWDEETPPATSAGLVPAGGINGPELVPAGPSAARHCVPRCRQWSLLPPRPSQPRLDLNLDRAIA